ncbi:MAG: hypothetical protein WCD38_11695 [Candidatus Tumulicola sp.]
MSTQPSKREEAIAFALRLATFAPDMPVNFGRANCAQELIAKAKALRALYERQCNGYQTPAFAWDERAEKRDERREERLEAAIRSIVAEVSAGKLSPVFNGDPRGASVRIVPAGQEAEADTNATLGFVVPDWA